MVLHSDMFVCCKAETLSNHHRFEIKLLIETLYHHWGMLKAKCIAGEFKQVTVDPSKIRYAAMKHFTNYI